MQRYGPSAVAAVLLLLGACAGQPKAPADTLTYTTASPDAETLQEIRTQAKPVPIAAAAEADEVICVRETPPGTLIPVRNCYTRSELREQARRTREWLNEELFEANAPL